MRRTPPPRHPLGSPLVLHGGAQRVETSKIPHAWGRGLCDWGSIGGWSQKRTRYGFPPPCMGVGFAIGGHVGVVLEKNPLWGAGVKETASAAKHAPSSTA